MRMILKTVASLIVIVVVVFMVYVRFAPSDPGQWNGSVLTTDPVTAGPCADKVTIVPKGARATCVLTGTPQEILAKLDAVAMADLRTTRLAGTPADVRITWVSRSRLMGYPDYITAEATQTSLGTRLDIFSRQRFGSGDAGVNAARLKNWLSSF